MRAARDGYVRLFRRVWDHPVFRNRAEAAIFAWMISEAAWSGQRVRTACGGPARLERGQLLISEQAVADDFGITKGALRTLLARMELDGMISRETVRVGSRAAGTIVRVQNYEVYQGDTVKIDAVDVNDHHPTITQPLPNHRTIISDQEKMPHDQGDDDTTSGAENHHPTITSTEVDRGDTTYKKKKEERRKKESKVQTPESHSPAKRAAGIVPARTPQVAFAALGQAQQAQFDRFWRAYDVDVRRREATAEFAAALERGVDPEVIIAGAERYAGSTPQRFRRNPCAWLAGEQWNDRPPDRRGGPDDHLDWYRELRDRAAGEPNTTIIGEFSRA